MRRIVKQREPQSLTGFRAAGGTSFDDLHGNQKQDLRKELVQEQRGLCCYCLCRIEAGDGNGTPPMKIAHWHSITSHHREQLDYANLLGACKGNEGQPRFNQHCDTRQGQNDIKYNPANPSHSIEQRIRFLTDGTICSDDADFNMQLNNILNLNWRPLKQRRREVLDRFHKELGDGRLSRAEWRRQLEKWNGDSHHGSLEPYCQVVVDWIRRNKL